MRDLSRRKPLRGYPDHSTTHPHARNAYQARYQDRLGREAMWQSERPITEQIFTELAPKRRLNFPAGNGRIAAAPERCLPACEIHDIDISNNMLAVARSKWSRLTFHAMDGRRALNEFGKEAFDVVSAFRFFPNADQPLRKDVAEQISGLIKPGGHVVLNNHRNFWSTSYVAMRAAGNSDGKYESHNAAKKTSSCKEAFPCTQIFACRMATNRLPPVLLSWSATSAPERFNVRYLSRTHTLGYNMILVFRKSV
ncbi:MAG: methyltransferase domain-containing protein [Rhodanobacteraceae bacterium]